MTTTTNRPARRRPGRPSRLTPATQARILSMVGSGTTYRTAAMAAGISERTAPRTWRAGPTTTGCTEGDNRKDAETW